MARFYGQIQGSRGEASRMGTTYSGFHAHIRGWHVGASVDMYPEEGDSDRCVIYGSTGSAGYNPRAECFGSLRNVNGSLVLTPTDWLIDQVKRHERKQRNEKRREARAAAIEAAIEAAKIQEGTNHV